MDCNNKYCYWNFNNQCIHECEEGYKSATQNQLDCPSSLRKDFENMLFELHDECEKLMRKRNFKELMDIRKFILNQKNSVKGLI